MTAADPRPTTRAPWRHVALVAALASACSSRSDRPAGEDHPSPEPSPVRAESAAERAPASGPLGALRFELSRGNAGAREHFSRGLLAIHSFWYDEAIRQFQAAIAADPSFDMGYWGLALSHCKILWGDDDLAAAKRALSQMPAPDSLSPREQAWVHALIALIKSPDVRASRTAFAAALEQIRAQFPDDESATFLAVALLSTIQPGAPDELALRRRAGELAQEVFARNPDHPGAAHYLIHAYDTPELAQLALPAARAYARIAPAAFHARHMPAHIFSRLGMWNQAIESCQAAWDVSLASAAEHELSAEHHDYHSLSWLVELNFERGRRSESDRAMKLYGDAVRGGLSHHQRSQYAGQVASYLARTGQWQRVDDLLAPLETPATDARAAMPAPVAPTPGGAPQAAGCADHGPQPGAPPVDLIEQRAVLATRARAAAAQRDGASARRLLDQLRAVDEKLVPYWKATQPPQAVDRIATSTDRTRRALLARSRGDDRALLAIQSEVAADSSQELAGEPAVSGSLIHEELAETLMRLRRPKEALAHYEHVLARQPGRARSLLGAARAAKEAGDAATSRARYAALVAQWSEAEPDTDGLAEARAAVSAD